QGHHPPSLSPCLQHPACRTETGPIARQVVSGSLIVQRQRQEGNENSALGPRCHRRDGNATQTLIPDKRRRLLLPSRNDMRVPVHPPPPVAGARARLVFVWACSSGAGW